MRLPKRGERGFTLIELLIVVAILGVLAAVVIPNVTRFVGAGKQEAAETELHNVQLAVTSMMLENGITTIPVPLNAVDPGPQTNHRNDMGAFPDATTAAASAYKLTDPEGYPYIAADKAGFILFGHDITGSNTLPDPPGANPNQDDVNYVTVQFTTYSYTCEADGTVQQWAVNGDALVWD